MTDCLPVLVLIKLSPDMQESPAVLKHMVDRAINTALYIESLSAAWARDRRMFV